MSPSLRAPPFPVLTIDGLFMTRKLAQSPGTKKPPPPPLVTVNTGLSSVTTTGGLVSPDSPSPIILNRPSLNFVDPSLVSDPVTLLIHELIVSMSLSPYISVSYFSGCSVTHT